MSERTLVLALAVASLTNLICLCSRLDAANLYMIANSEFFRSVTSMQPG
jgi:hypothetical protein